MARSFFSTYLEGGMRAGPWLPSSFGDPEARKAAVARAAGRTVDPSLITALTRLDAELPRSEARRQAIGELALGGTAAIVTGQQVGLFLGPLYTIYKAATAIVLARALEAESGVRCVPVFWMATEDHDFAEIDHAAVPRRGAEPLRLRVTAEEHVDPRQPVGALRLGPDVELAVAALGEALQARRCGGEVMALVTAAYQTGRTFAQAFARLLASLFAPEGLVIVDPRAPELAALSLPAWRIALGRAEEIAARLGERNAALEAAGLTAQVSVRPDAALVFHLDERGGRQVVRALDARVLADAEVDPLRLSSSALVRPIVQDTIFPTAAYVGGPGEVGYLAQSAVLYELFGLPVPLVAPRARFRLVDARTRARLDALGLAAADVEQPRDAFVAAVGARRPAPLSPDQLRAALLDGPRQVFSELPAKLGLADRELSRAFVRTRATVERAVERLAQRYARTLALRDGETAGALHRLQLALFPDGAPQERVYGFASYAADAGPRPFVTGILDAIRPFDPTVQDLAT